MPTDQCKGPKRIGLNLLFLIPGVVGGTETYAAGLLQGLAMVAPDDEFVVFVNREAAEWPLPVGVNFTRVVCPVTGSNRLQRYTFEQVELPRLLRQQRIDLVHSLGYVGPIVSPCPAVVTIPDLNYVDLAQTIPLHRRLALRLISTQAAKAANEIITISNFSKGRLCKTLKIPADRITVTHLAPRAELALSASESWPELRQMYGIREPYVAAFGGGAVHKNVDALLQAFAGLSTRWSHSLVLVGHLPPDVQLPIADIERHRSDLVIATGYVPAAHIRPLLGHAELFVLPSLYEGFGLPVLEAQEAGVAVACSTAGSLPEVAGEGAKFFDPYSTETIGEALICCLSDPDLRAGLRQKGRENLKRFSWQTTAMKTHAVYEQALATAAKSQY